MVLYVLACCVRTGSALARAVSASLRDDRFGTVKGDIGAVVELLLRALSALEQTAPLHAPLECMSSPMAYPTPGPEEGEGARLVWKGEGVHLPVRWVVIAQRGCCAT